MYETTKISFVALLIGCTACTNLLGIGDFTEQDEREAAGDSDTPGAGGDDGAGGAGGGPQPGTQAWALAFGSASGTDMGQSVSVTAGNDLIITGTIGEGVDFGGGALGDAPDQFYVTRLDSEGEFKSGFASVGGASVTLGSTAVDGGGNAVVAGSYSGGTLDVDGTVLHDNAGGEDLFISKIRTDGTAEPLAWSVRATGADDQRFNAVATNESGSIVAAVGFIIGTVAFDTPLAGEPDYTGAGNEDAFVALFNADGELTFAKNYGSGRSQTATAVAIDENDKIWVAGTFDGTIELEDGNPHSSVSSSDIFLARMSSNGTVEMSVRFGSGGGHTVGGIVPIDGGVVLVGGFTGTTSFGGDPLEAMSTENNSLEDIFVVSLGSDGDHRWSKSFGGTGDDFAHTVVVDLEGNVVVGGSFSATIEAFGAQKNSAGGADALVLKLDASGEALWCTAFGRNDDDRVGGIAVDDENSVIATGQFVEGFMLGEEVIKGKGLEDIFVAKLLP